MNIFFDVSNGSLCQVSICLFGIKRSGDYSAAMQVRRRMNANSIECGIDEEAIKQEVTKYEEFVKIQEEKKQPKPMKTGVLIFDETKVQSKIMFNFADDTTAVLADTDSAVKLFEILNLFEIISGLKINCSKTEGMWIGSLRNDKAKPFDIKWPDEPIKALGVYFTYNQKLLKEKNFIERLDSVKKLINIWSSRGLSIYEGPLYPFGKWNHVKILGFSRVTCKHQNPFTFTKIEAITFHV